MIADIPVKTPAQPIRRLMFTSRRELDIDLMVKEGRIPDDIYGHVFICYPVGSINSNGVPFPEFNPDGSENQEYGSPLMNGDGMLMRVSFDQPGKARLTMKLMRPPCFYADEASKWGSKNHEAFGFKNFGIARISLKLGARNLLNTAVIPVKFADNKSTFLLSTYDVGRPFTVDPINMKVKTPVGKNRSWVSATPPFMHLPFAMVQSTAHPAFDPSTSELFTVNYSRDSSAMLASKHLFDHLRNNKEELLKKFEAVVTEAEQEKDKRAGAEKIKQFYDGLEKLKEKEEGSLSLWDMVKRMVAFTWNLIMLLLKPFMREFETTDKVYLLKWDGRKECDRWELRDEQNKAIKITQCMHQMSLSADYIFLTDTSFKFSVDLLINNPFPENKDLDRRVRELTASVMEPYTDGYIVKRSDLKPGKKIVNVKKLRLPVPLEVIHYSAEYANPGNKITIYCVHNAAACVAEWLRPYDVSKINGQPIDKNVISMFALGEMDISRFGKFVIDAEKAEISEQEILCLPGDFSKKDIGPHTWGVGLYAFRNMISADKNVNSIEDIYFTASGPDPRMLSEYIFNLYQDYPNRFIAVDELLKRTQEGVPFSIVRVNTKKMQAADYYQFEEIHYPRSIQYVPKKRKENDMDEASLSTDGYIFCTVQVGEKMSDGEITYRSECWIFDAANLHQGAVCRLTHPDLAFCFTLHSSWMPETAAYDLKYNIDIEKDYNDMIRKIWLPFKRSEIQQFFNEHVYPHFKS